MAGEATTQKSAFTQLRLSEAPRVLRLLVKECPRVLIRLPSRRRPERWDNIAEPVVLGERNFYGCQVGNVFTSIENHSCSCLSFVDDIKMLEREQYLEPMWNTVLNEVHLVCTQREADDDQEAVQSQMDLFRLETRAVANENENKKFVNRSQLGVTTWENLPQNASKGIVNWLARTSEGFFNNTGEPAPVCAVFFFFKKYKQMPPLGQNWKARLVMDSEHLGKSCYRQSCHVGDNVEDCRFGLLQDATHAGDDSRTSSSAVLCVFGKKTFVPIRWMCKKQSAVSHISAESEVISLDAVLRLEGLSFGQSHVF